MEFVAADDGEQEFHQILILWVAERSANILEVAHAGPGTTSRMRMDQPLGIHVAFEEFPQDAVQAGRIQGERSGSSLAVRVWRIVGDDATTLPTEQHAACFRLDRREVAHDVGESL